MPSERFPAEVEFFGLAAEEGTKRDPESDGGRAEPRKIAKQSQVYAIDRPCACCSRAHDRLLSVAISPRRSAPPRHRLRFCRNQLFVPLPSPPRSVPPLPLAPSTSVDCLCLLSTLHLPCRRCFVSVAASSDSPFSGERRRFLLTALLESLLPFSRALHVTCFRDDPHHRLCVHCPRFAPALATVMESQLLGIWSGLGSAASR